MGYPQSLVPAVTEPCGGAGIFLCSIRAAEAWSMTKEQRAGAQGCAVEEQCSGAGMLRGEAGLCRTPVLSIPHIAWAQAGLEGTQGAGACMMLISSAQGAQKGPLREHGPCSNLNTPGNPALAQAA